jgi:Tol biopolymer transport system component
MKQSEENMKRIAWFFTLCLLLTALSACGGAGGGQGGMVYVVWQDINTDSVREAYYLADPQAQPVQIAAAKDGVFVRFSPDGSQLAVLSMVEAPMNSASVIPVYDYTLQTMNPDGQNKFVWVTMQGNAGRMPEFLFSLDSKTLIFSQCTEKVCNEVALYFGDLSNGNKELKTSAPSLNIQSLSPAQKVLVSQRDPDARKTRFYYYDLAGGKTEITSIPDYTIVQHFVFTSNGQVLAKAMDINSAESLLLAGSADLTNWQPLTAPEIEVRDFLVSPDGKKALVYLTSLDCSSSQQLARLVDLQSGQSKDVGCGFANSLVDFSPDSSEFIWVDEQIFIHRISAGGEELEKLPNGTSWVRYSADGSQIAYWLRDSTAKQACIYLRPRAGGEATRLEQTCISTADMAAMPGYLLWYGPWRSPDNTW